MKWLIDLRLMKAKLNDSSFITYELKSVLAVAGYFSRFHSIACYKSVDSSGCRHRKSRSFSQQWMFAIGSCLKYSGSRPVS